MEVLKSIRYYDDNDELYNEYNITFEYNRKKVFGNSHNSF